MENVKYPGIPTTGDGSEAAVWVETHVSQAAVTYPITPSTNMGYGYQVAVANGRTNLWGEPLMFLEPESEHSAGSAAEGFALAGGRVTSFTASQGLVLQKEVLHVISGKRLPAVFHIGARALTSQALNIHAGHDDVYAVADTGWGILFAGSAQEVADLALIARRASEDSHTPFMVAQDGFLNTHTVENYNLPEPELMKQFVGDPAEKLVNYFDPDNPVLTGPVENQDAYMKGRIAQRAFYARVVPALEEAFREYERLTGRSYDFVKGYRLEDAEYAIVAMASMTFTIEAVVDALRERGIKAGLLRVYSYRPFPAVQIVEALKHVKAFAVLERTDEPLAGSNPLTRDVKAAFADALDGYPGFPQVDRLPKIYSGAAGLGGRDIRPADVMAVFDHLIEQGNRRFFVLNIKHPLALEPEEDVDITAKGTFRMRGYSVGGFGSVTTNKVIASTTADLFGLYVQAFPKYGSEKKGLPTNYYLTVAEEPVRIRSELRNVEMIAINDPNALHYTNPFKGLKPGGVVWMQSFAKDARDVWASIPAWARRTIRENGYRLFAIDTVDIAREVSSRPDLVMRMQGIVLLGVYLRVAPFVERLKLSEEELWERVEKIIRKYFGKRGEQVVKDNMTAIQRGYREIIEVPADVIATEPEEVGA
ncbi:2-oxoacid:acceptor oxidoreductase family protein [Oceanithermus sp.]